MDSTAGAWAEEQLHKEMEALVLLVLLARMEKPVLLVLLVLLARMERPVLLVLLVLLAHMEKPGLLVLLAHMEKPVLLALLAHHPVPFGKSPTDLLSPLSSPSLQFSTLVQSLRSLR
jgi:hypothetical protein